ncbi:MAG TPA: hypothetical protein VKV21_05665 [Solirubrobacteraceae bacterium]|nr:hypothetical protein [Solirubrobacteraceae bacterium]
MRNATRTLPPVERFIDALLERDGAGGSWLARLLRAAPRGRARFGELADAPGWLQAPVAVRTETGRRGAFEYPAVPSRELLGWFIDHPERLNRVEDADASAETLRLRSALLDDDPPGARARAQDRAHDLLRERTPFGDAWWRFEPPRVADCLLMTDRLVLLVSDGASALAPATPWFPPRTGLARDLEAARRFAEGHKAWGVLVLGLEDDAADADAILRRIGEGAPHLDADAHHELAAGYLGGLGWPHAAAATGLDPTAF